MRSIVVFGMSCNADMLCLATNAGNFNEPYYQGYINTDIGATPCYCATPAQAVPPAHIECVHRVACMPPLSKRRSDDVMSPTASVSVMFAGQLFEDAGLVPHMKTVASSTKALSFKKPLHSSPPPAPAAPAPPATAMPNGCVFPLPSWCGVHRSVVCEVVELHLPSLTEH